MKIMYKISLITIIVLFVFSLFIVYDYSKFNQHEDRINDGAMVLSEENLSINYSSGNTFYINDLKDEHLIEKKFSVTNIGTSTLYYTISFNDIEYEVEEASSLKYSLKSDNEVVINEEVFPLEASEITSLITIPPGTSQNYTLIIKSDESIASNNSLKGIISIKSKDNNQSFSDVILMNNQIKELVSKPGKEISSSDEGLIAGNDDDGVTYYFRGDVRNNYVKFADQIWRIVRINGDKSVRIVLDKTIENTYSYNTNELEEGNDNYSTLVSFDKSSIKKSLEDWYDFNISASAKYVVNSNFCIDTNISKEEGNSKYYQSYVRVNEDENPLHNCIGTKIFTNIGLLSVDEAILAGSYKDKENKNTYLYNSDITEDWWLNSPHSITSENIVKMFTYQSETGSISNGIDIQSLRGIRPVINIRDTVNVTGTGIEEDPYVIE